MKQTTLAFKKVDKENLQTTAAKKSFPKKDPLKSSSNVPEVVIPDDKPKTVLPQKPTNVINGEAKVKPALELNVETKNEAISPKVSPKPKLTKAEREAAAEAKRKEKEEKRLLREKEAAERKAKKEKEDAEKAKRKLEREEKAKERKEEEAKRKAERAKKEEERLKKKELEEKAKAERLAKKEQEKLEKAKEKEAKEAAELEEKRKKERKNEKARAMMSMFVKIAPKKEAKSDTEKSAIPPFTFKFRGKLFQPGSSDKFSKLPTPNQNITPEKFDLYLTYIRSKMLTCSNFTHNWRQKINLKSDTSNDDVMMIDDSSNDAQNYPRCFYKFSTCPRYRFSTVQNYRKENIKRIARNPFRKYNKDGLDYDEDSEYDWENEPSDAESIGSDDDDDEENSSDDNSDNEDKFFVPHGYLSEEEDVEAHQKNKDKSLEYKKNVNLDGQSILYLPSISEQHSQQNEIVPLLKRVGCTVSQIEALTNSLRDNLIVIGDENKFKNTYSTEGHLAPLKPAKNSEKITSKIAFPKMKQLIQLVHNNPIGVEKLTEEFSIFCLKNLDPKYPAPTKVQIRKRIRQIATYDNADKESSFTMGKTWQVEQKFFEKFQADRSVDCSTWVYNLGDVEAKYEGFLMKEQDKKDKLAEKERKKLVREEEAAERARIKMLKEKEAAGE